MRLLPPIHIPRLATSNGSAILTASTVGYTEYSQWSNLLTYSTGDIRRCTRDPDDDGVWRNYRSKLDSNNGNYPPDNPGWWTDLGPVNRFRMFQQDPDAAYATLPNTDMQSTTPSGTDLVVTLEPGEAVDTIALHNVVGDSVRVVVVDPSGPTTVYDDTTSLLIGGVQAVFDWAVTDLPATVSPPEITITIADTAGVGAACGLCTIGRAVPLGFTLLGYSAGIRDHSTKQIDAEGLVTLVQGRSRRWVSADVWVDSAADVPGVLRQLTTYRATPLSWIGSASRTEAVLYGYYRDFTLTIPSAVHAICSLEIDGF